MRILFSEYTFDKWFNTGIAALSAHLKKHGHEVHLLRHVDGLGDVDYESQLKALKPDLLGFSTMSFQWGMTQNMASIAKRVLPDVPVLVGGYHATFHTQEVISSPYVDFACVGEGEEPLLDLVQILDGTKKDLDITKIPSIWTKKDGKVCSNAVRPPVANLDDLPFWDRDLFDYDKIFKETGRAALFHEPHNMAVAAARGCPWTCTYCSNEGYLQLYKGMGRYPRSRSIPHLMEELKGLAARYPIAKFEFWDEVFGVNPRWMEEFAATYKKEFPNTPYTCFLRIEQTKSDKLLRQLAESGCTMVLMGTESGDEDYRKKYLGRTMSNEALIQGYRRLREYGIETTSLNMMGLPYETVDNMRRTIDLNREMEPDVMCIFVFQPFPGTILYEICKKEGWLPEDAFKPSWLLAPELAIRQPSVSHDEIAVVHQEFLRLQGELEEKRIARRRANAMMASTAADPDPTAFISM